MQIGYLQKEMFNGSGSPIGPRAFISRRRIPKLLTQPSHSVEQQRSPQCKNTKVQAASDKVEKLPCRCGAAVCDTDSPVAGKLGCIGEVWIFDKGKEVRGKSGDVKHCC
jgi:hypothetical protein